MARRHLTGRNPSAAQEATGAAFDTTVPAFVFRIGHYPVHHGAVGVVRSLGRLGIPVYANTGDHLAPLARSRFLAQAFRWVADADRPDDVLTGLDRIASTIGRPAVIIPTDDEAALFIGQHAGRLQGKFLMLTAPASTIRSVSDKAALAVTCRRFGIGSPKSTVACSTEELDRFLDHARFPLVVKATEAALVRSRGMRSTSIVTDEHQARALVDAVGFESPARLLLQEHIGDGEDWFFHGCCDERSRLLVGYSGVKVRSYPAHAGPTSYGRWEPNEHLTCMVESLMRSVGYRGIFDLDVRYDRRDGQFKLLDFNPRVGAQFRLFEDAQQIDVVRALHLHLTGRRVPEVKPQPGRTFMVETADPASLPRYARERQTGPRRWLDEARHVDEWAWLTPDDPVPAVMAVLRLAARRVAKAASWLSASRHRPAPVTESTPALNGSDDPVPAPHSRPAATEPVVSTAEPAERPVEPAALPAEPIVLPAPPVAPARS
jgi:predicted ATP-grasp superfamily ATP-dependent carboligase